MAGDEGSKSAVSRVRILVAGRVQGVGYRHFAVQAAHAGGLRGDVRNLPDGRVEVRAEGPRVEIERLTKVLRSGPPAARVDDVDVVALDEPFDASGFRVRA